MKRSICLLIILFVFLVLSGCQKSESTVIADEPPIQEIVDTPEPEPTENPEELYVKAIDLLYSCEFDSAKELFSSLNGLKDSKEMVDYCDYRIQVSSEEPAPLYIKDEYEIKGIHALAGKYYISNLAYIYVPDEIKKDTQTIVYYAGGGGEEPILEMFSMPHIYEYFPKHAPNAVIIMLKRSGFTSMSATNAKVIDMIRQLELDLQYVAHDVAIVGSSNGCFTANRAAVQLWTDGKIKVAKLLDMDQGNEWIPINTNDNLTDEECKLLAEEGTEVYLFEQHDVGMNVEAIANMVNHGVNVTVVECVHDDHNSITVYMYKEDIFGWITGEYSDLNEDEYTMVKLEKAS